MIPSKYLISKGISFPLLQEGDEPPTMKLECYEYNITEGEDGWYLAECEELNAITQAKVWEDLKDNILEVHSLMVDDDN